MYAWEVGRSSGLCCVCCGCGLCSCVRYKRCARACATAARAARRRRNTQGQLLKVRMRVCYSFANSTTLAETAGAVNNAMVAHRTKGCPVGALPRVKHTPAVVSTCVCFVGALLAGRVKHTHTHGDKNVEAGACAQLWVGGWAHLSAGEGGPPGQKVAARHKVQQMQSSHTGQAHARTRAPGDRPVAAATRQLARRCPVLAYTLYTRTHTNPHTRAHVSSRRSPGSSCDAPAGTGVKL